MTSRTRFLRLAVAGLAAQLLGGCAGDGEPTATSAAERARATQDPGVRQVHVALDERNGQLREVPLDVVANPALNVTFAGATHLATASVHVSDGQGKPVSGVRVTGSFLGNVGGRYTGITDGNGVFEAAADGYPGHVWFGFQIETVEYPSHNGWQLAVTTTESVKFRQCNHTQPSQ